MATYWSIVKLNSLALSKCKNFASAPIRFPIWGNPFTSYWGKKLDFGRAPRLSSEWLTCASFGYFCPCTLMMAWICSYSSDNFLNFTLIRHLKWDIAMSVPTTRGLSALWSSRNIIPGWKGCGIASITTTPKAKNKLATAMHNFKFTCGFILDNWNDENLKKIGKKYFIIYFLFL